MSNRILVTGAAGFIGSHLCEALLKQGYHVTGVDNFDAFYTESIKRDNLTTSLNHQNFNFLEGDAGDADILNGISYNIDAVVHLAAKAGVLPSLKDPQAYINSNIKLTNSLLEWMQIKSIKKLIFASSSSVYGNNAKIPFDEKDHVDEPISPYAFTKRSCELMNYTYHSLYGLDVINLRFFTVYGERQRPDLAIHKFVNRIMNDQPITLYGDGETARDYTYYRDTINGIINSLNYIMNRSGVYEIVNLGNHSPVSLNELIKAIAGTLNVEPQLSYEDMKPGDVKITYANIEKAKKLLDYNPETTLNEGLLNFINWYKTQNLEVFK